jgi:hypothetical protein
MKYLHVFALIAAFAFICSGCGSSSSSTKETSAAPEEREHRVLLSRYEKMFNPSEYDVEITEVQRQHRIEQERAAAERQEDSVVVESTFTQGYRIQIFASGSIDEANAMRMTAVQKINEDSIYVVYDPPTYKVRIGDFPTRSEANQKLAAVVAQGFADAWVVGDRIIQRKLVRVPVHPQAGKF